MYIHVWMVLNTYSPCVYSFSSQLGMHTKEVDVHLESNLNRIFSEDFDVLSNILSTARDYNEFRSKL